MPHKDWIPHREQDFVDLCHEWALVLGNAANVAKWGWNPQEAAAVVGKINDFLAAREAYAANRTPLNRLEKDERKAVAVAAMRGFANTSIRFNNKMTEAERLALGIRPQDNVKTKRPAPTLQPNTLAENTVNHFEHKIVAMNPETQTPHKPDGVHGVRYACQVGGERPANGSDLGNGKFTAKTRHVVTHKAADRGKTAYYATCYENAKGDPGPWSEIVEAVIG